MLSSRGVSGVSSIVIILEWGQEGAQSSSRSFERKRQGTHRDEEIPLFSSLIDGRFDDGD